MVGNTGEDEGEELVLLREGGRRIESEGQKIYRIGCDDGSGDGGCGSTGFSITVVEAFKLSVNGVPVRVEETPRTLEFGDEIKLEGEESSLVFYFMAAVDDQAGGEERTFSDSIADNSYVDVDEPALAPMPAQIHVVVQKLLVFLPLPDVKEARLVSKLWAEEGAIQLRKRARLAFDFSDNSNSSLSRRSDVWTGHPSWRIKICNAIFDPSATFMEKSASALSNLHLILDPKTPQDFQTFSKLLELLRPFLEVLEFSFVMRSEAPLPPPDVFNNLSGGFPSLRTLVIERKHYHPGDEGCAICPKWDELVRTFILIPQPQLTSFGMKLEDNENKTEEFQIGIESKDVVKTTPSFYSHIKRTWGGGGGGDDEDDTAGTIHDGDSIDMSQLRIVTFESSEEDALELFVREGPTLKSVELTLTTPFALAIPKMPSLRTFKLVVVSSDEEEDDSSGGVTFLGCGGGSSFQNFPVLQSLELEIRGDNGDKSIKKYVAPFFQNLENQKGPASRTLVRLELPLNSHAHFGVGWDKLTEAFPFVIFPELDAALEEWKAKVEAKLDSMPRLSKDLLRNLDPDLLKVFYLAKSNC